MEIKKIGLIGGMGPVSTIDYYRYLIELYQTKIDSQCYPLIAIDSLNLTQVLSLIAKDDMEGTARLLASSAENLKKAGCSICAICANTPHIAWKDFSSITPLKAVSIVESSLNIIKQDNLKKVIIFGTEATMTNGLYEKPLKENGIEAIIPTDEDRKTIAGIIFPRLEQGIVDKEDKKRIIALANKYAGLYNADSLLLGCTELPLIIKSEDLEIKVLDTTRIHAEAIFSEALK